MRLFSLLFVLATTLLLTACNGSETKTYQYFMLHPKTIQAELQSCKGSALASPECAAAVQAAQDMNALLAQASSNAQLFGAALIKDQTALAQAAQALETARNGALAVQDSSDNNAIQAASLNLQKAQQAYDAADFKVKTKLAALALMGP